MAVVRGRIASCILIVAEKPSSTATNLKLRLIPDCRYINGFLNKIPFSMERLKRLCEATTTT